MIKLYFTDNFCLQSFPHLRATVNERCVGKDKAKATKGSCLMDGVETICVYVMPGL